MTQLFEDKSLPVAGASDEDKRDFQIAWLHRRVENLEAIVFTMLKDRVPYEDVANYRDMLLSPGFAPSSVALKDATKRIAYAVTQDWPKETLGWPTFVKGKVG